jgi:hypothetical protein
MPAAFPERRPTALTRWHIIGLVFGCVAITLLLWTTMDRGSKPAHTEEPKITTGIAPTDQSGKPLPR